MPRMQQMLFFFFNDPATTEIYTLSLHDALPILDLSIAVASKLIEANLDSDANRRLVTRSEEHTSELQSHSDLVCRLLLEKKKGCVTVTPVHMDKVPMVPDLGQAQQFVVTIQPAV